MFSVLTFGYRWLGFETEGPVNELVARSITVIFPKDKELVTECECGDPPEWPLRSVKLAVQCLFWWQETDDFKPKGPGDPGRIRKGPPRKKAGRRELTEPRKDLLGHAWVRAARQALSLGSSTAGATPPTATRKASSSGQGKSRRVT